MSSESRRIRQEAQLKPKFVNEKPNDDSGKNGDSVYLRSGNGVEEFVKDEGRWLSLKTGRPAGEKAYIGRTSTRQASGTLVAAASTSGGTGNHNLLSNLNDDDHSQYVHITSNRTVSAQHTYSGNNIFTGIPAFNGGTSGSSSPFTVDSTQKVDNLNADQVDGKSPGTGVGDIAFYDSSTRVLDSQKLDGLDSASYFILNQNETVTGRPAFVGGESGSNPPFTVDSTDVVSNLNADKWDGYEFSDYLNQAVKTTSSPQYSNITIGEYSSPNYSNGNIGTSTYVSGFTGSGWKIDKSGNEYNFETDNMSIRGTLSVYELLIQQIRATNGSIFVSAAAKVDTVSGSSGSETIVFEDPSDHNICPFAAGDIIMAQRVRLDSTTLVKRVVRKVSSVNGDTVVVTSATSGPSDTGAVESGDDFVRIGNEDSTNYSNRQGGVYLTADDSNAPFIDVFDGVNSWTAWTGASKTKARLGKLDGITDTASGLSGSQNDLYGLYSDDVYLTGHIQAKTGYIGTSTAGWTITSNSITNAGNTSFIGVGSGGYGASNQYLWLGAADVSGTTKGKFSLGDKLTWDGSTLYVKGQLVLTNGDSVGAGITWKGTYNAGVAYVKNDAVVYQSASYIALQSTTGNTPSSGSSYWDLLADQGDTGQNGQNGQDGSPGSNGSDGHVYKQFYVYKNGSSAPSTPSGGSVNSSAVMTPPSGWANAPSTPSSGQFTYTSTSVWKQTNGSGSYAIDTAWASPSKFSGDTGAQGETGETGETGQNGQNGADGAQGPAGNDGAPGSNGAAGTRGSRHYYYTVTGSSWSDSDANTAISNAGDTKVDRDTVTLSKANTFSTTKYWDGDSWEAISQVVDGNLIVHGTVGANQVDADDIFTESITVTNNIKLGSGGKLHTNGKDSITDNTTGIFIGHDGGSNYDLAIGDGTNHVKWDGSAGTMTIRGTLNANDINAGILTGRTVRTAASGDRIVMDGTANSISLIDANDYSRVVIDDNDNAPDDNPGYNQIISHATDQNHTGSWTDGNYGTWTHPKGRQCQVRIELYSVQSDVTAYVKVMGYAGSSWYQLAYDSHSFSQSGTTVSKYLHYSSGTATSFKIQVYGEHDEGGVGTPSATLHMYVREYKQASYLNHTGMHWVGNGMYARLGPNTEQLPTAMASNSDIDGDDAFVCTGNAHLYKKLIFSNAVGTSETSRWTMRNETGNLYFRKYGSVGNAVTGLGYLGSSNISQIDFTGQHRCIGNSGMTASQYGAMIGYIVRADGKYNNISDNGTSASINESLPVIELSDSNNDKRVFGVISSHEDNNREYQQGTFVTVYDIPENDERVIINSLGEGGIWVTNLNGNLENGDYITTSTAAGLGQKQDDDLLHNYTVAKITQDCDFSGGTDFEHNGQTYKKQFVGCTYHCG